MGVKHGGKKVQVFALKKSLNRRVGILFAENWELLKVFEQRHNVMKWSLGKTNQAVTNGMNRRGREKGRN